MSVKVGFAGFLIQCSPEDFVVGQLHCGESLKAWYIAAADGCFVCKGGYLLGPELFIASGCDVTSSVYSIRSIVVYD